MAIGAALLFNIKLPINFNSPYKALDIQDFWRRWHITLSRFLRDYLYIPLGGNRKGSLRTYTNLLATFIIGGIWHGAGWTFVFWGFLHGMALVIHRFWKSMGLTMPKIVAWFITFNFINIAWVFFRAKEWDDALKVLEGMLTIPFINTTDPFTLFIMFSSIFIAFSIVLFAKNSSYYLSKKITIKHMILAAIVFAYAISKSLGSSSEVFLYYNF
jgi:D-alanyl-lipoteichoic acid acyltransferase DltB (MBOAT superfamily)